MSFDDNQEESASNFNDSARASDINQRSNFLPAKDEDYPYKAMYLMINGQIESASIPDNDGICIKFDILHGTEWVVKSGNETGVSQHAYKSMSTNDRVVWNFPFEMTYRMNDIPGWPKIVLSLTCRDFWGRDIICGYGIMHVPT